MICLHYWLEVQLECLQRRFGFDDVVDSSLSSCLLAEFCQISQQLFASNGKGSWPDCWFSSNLDFLWDLLTRLRKSKIKLQHRLPNTERVPFRFVQSLQNLFCYTSSNILLGMPKWIFSIMLDWTKSAELQYIQRYFVQGQVSLIKSWGSL